MLKKLLFTFFLLCFLSIVAQKGFSQCGFSTNMDPGYRFLNNSIGCAPFTVQLETFYLNAVAGTRYYVTWGDGTPEEIFDQTNATGVVILHTYPNAATDCGYNLVIDASNSCNPRGSVALVNTEVIVWTKDVLNIDPREFRVCQGFATDISFTDASAWNCFQHPNSRRANNEPRWVQWIYGTGPIANQLSGIQVNTILPSSFPYLNPAPATNPFYPVLAPGQLSLPLNVPATAPADVGKEFVVTLKNWNQCSPYDNNLADGSGLNPVSGDLVNGDNAPQVTTARIVIVPSPQPSFVTRLNDAGGAIKTVFCVDETIYFDDETPSIGGASFQYTWQFFDNATGTGAPVATSNAPNPTYSYSTAGQKLIRLTVKDGNAAGNCVNSFDLPITISPSVVAKINVTDLSNNPITPDFCQEATAPFTTFQVRFSDVSIGTVSASTERRWEFYNESNVLVRQEPASGFSSVVLGPFDQPYSNKGIYSVKLLIRDNVTSCKSEDEVQVRVYEKPLPAFTATRVCEGELTSFTESSTLNAINGETISLREWDFNYNGTTFNKDAAFDNKTSFTRALGTGSTYQVALRVTASQSNCSAMLIIPVTVDPLPIANFTANPSQGCAPLTVIFTNNSVTGQPDVIDRFVWEVDAKDGLGFQQVGLQKPTDVGFVPSFTYKFVNTTSTNKIYDVRLKVVTVNRCERISAPVTITVFPGTEAGFSELNYSPFNDNCSPISVNFRADTQTQSLNPTDYTWKVSDANGLISQTSTATNPNFDFTFSNTTNSIKDYFVNLQATLAGGCTGDSTRVIRVSPVPASLFLIDTLQFDCKILKVRLTASQKGLLSYHWVISENGFVTVNQTSSQDAIERTFNRPSPSGSPIAVQFSLDTENFANCPSTPSTFNLVVPIQDNINTSFTATPTTQSLPNSTVVITNTTNPGPWSYLWDFGDNTPTSTDPTIASHTYATYGTYVITLKVTNNVCVETVTQTVTILAIPPEVDFSYDPASGCVPLKVTFTNLSKYADAATYKWEFGDSNSSTEENPVHVYSRAGTYTVSLSASNVTGQVVSEIKQQIIEVFPKPIANFDVKPRVIDIPGGILYTSNLSLDATSFAWDFGDGGTSTEAEPQYSYTKEGTFTIQLIASNRYGCADTAVLKNVVQTKKSGKILVPNAFSPGAGGGDGKNDSFLPVMRGVTEFEFLVFSRWGELLFQSRDANQGWDGTYNGKLCAQDVYMYKIIAKFEDGETTVRVGDVNLIR